MTHPIPAPCCDTVLYAVTGRALPRPVKSWAHDTPNIDALASAQIAIESTRAAASGCDIQLFVVTGTGPIKPVDIDALVAAKVAEAMARLPLLQKEED